MGVVLKMPMPVGRGSRFLTWLNDIVFFAHFRLIFAYQYTCKPNAAPVCFFYGNGNDGTRKLNYSIINHNHYQHISSEGHPFCGTFVLGYNVRTVFSKMLEETDFGIQKCETTLRGNVIILRTSM